MVRRGRRKTRNLIGWSKEGRIGIQRGVLWVYERVSSTVFTVVKKCNRTFTLPIICKHGNVYQVNNSILNIMAISVRDFSATRVLFVSHVHARHHFHLWFLEFFTCLVSPCSYLEKLVSYLRKNWLPWSTEKYRIYETDSRWRHGDEYQRVLKLYGTDPDKTCRRTCPTLRTCLDTDSELPKWHWSA